MEDPRLAASGVPHGAMLYDQVGIGKNNTRKYTATDKERDSEQHR
jgi:hypothetical protein